MFFSRLCRHLRPGLCPDDPERCPQVACFHGSPSNAGLSALAHLVRHQWGYSNSWMVYNVYIWKIHLKKVDDLHQWGYPKSWSMMILGDPWLRKAPWLVICGTAQISMLWKVMPCFLFLWSGIPLRRRPHIFFCDLSLLHVITYFILCISIWFFTVFTYYYPLFVVCPCRLELGPLEIPPFWKPFDAPDVWLGPGMVLGPVVVWVKSREVR